MLDPKVFDHHTDVEAIRGASYDDVVVALCAWFDSWTGVSYIDWEYIMYAGGDTARARNNVQEAFDMVVLGWLKREPDVSGERHFIGASFLEGYWGWGSGVAISLPCVEELKNALERYPRGRCGYSELLVALHHCLHRKKELDIVERRKIQATLIEHLRVFEEAGEPKYMIQSLACVRRDCDE
ncbi:MAG: hypothetical protein HZA36_02395 [Parcubacteria group bacterium]|nr:hypothetical protein [Parcubacteria group bacterium]